MKNDKLMHLCIELSNIIIMVTWLTTEFVRTFVLRLLEIKLGENVSISALSKNMGIINYHGL